MNKGDLLGWFNMGSTVIVLLPAGTSTWLDSATAGTTVRVGTAIAARAPDAANSGPETAA